MDAYSQEVIIEALTIEGALINSWFIFALRFVSSEILFTRVGRYLIYPDVKVVVLLRLVINLIQEYFVIPRVHDSYDMVGMSRRLSKV